MDKRIFIYLVGGVLTLSAAVSCAYSQPAPVPVTVESQQLQTDRSSTIQKLIDGGLFSKVQISGTHPEVWVEPVFYLLDFDKKSTAIGIVYAYYHTMDPNVNVVIVMDNKTGKEIGLYAEVYGGLKLE